MKPLLWITACCAGLSTFQVLADEDYAPTGNPPVASAPQVEAWTAPPLPAASGDRPHYPPMPHGQGYPPSDNYSYRGTPGYDAASMPPRPEAGATGFAPHHRRDRSWDPSWDQTRPMMPPEQGAFDPSGWEDYPHGRDWTGGPGAHGYGMEPGYGYAPPQTYRMPHDYEQMPGYGYAPSQAYPMPYGQEQTPGYGYAPAPDYRMPYGYEQSPGYGYGYAPPQGYEQSPSYYGYAPPRGYPGPRSYHESPEYGYPRADYRQPMMAPGYGYGAWPDAPEYDHPAFPDAPPMPQYYRSPAEGQGYDQAPGHPMHEGETAGFGYGPPGFRDERGYPEMPAPGYERPLPMHDDPRGPGHGHPPADYSAPGPVHGADVTPSPPPPAETEGDRIGQPQPVTPEAGSSASQTETGLGQPQPELSPSEGEVPASSSTVLEQPISPPPTTDEVGTDASEAGGAEEPASEEPQPAVEEENAPESPDKQEA